MWLPDTRYRRCPPVPVIALASTPAYYQPSGLRKSQRGIHERSFMRRFVSDSKELEFHEKRHKAVAVPDVGNNYHKPS